MKVLLCEDVRTLGWLGDVVEVSDGYARNYLLPQGLAKAATEANLKAIAKEKAERAEQRIHDRSRMEEAAKAVEGAEAVLAAKANEQGVLFGSITAEQIAENLRAQGFEVADEIVHLPEHIKQVGAHTVKLKFSTGCPKADKDLTAAVNVVVVPEGGDAASVLRSCYSAKYATKHETTKDESAPAEDKNSTKESEKQPEQQETPEKEK